MPDSSKGFCICSSPSSNVLILVGEVLNVGGGKPIHKNIQNKTHQERKDKHKDQKGFSFRLEEEGDGVGKE